MAKVMASQPDDGEYVVPLDKAVKNRPGLGADAGQE